MKLFLVLTLLWLEVVASTSLDLGDPDADVGLWKVDDCIIAQFAMDFTIRPHLDNPNATLIVKVAPNATVNAEQSRCGNQTQKMVLNWKIPERNSTRFLDRNMTLTFARENTTL